MNIRVKKYYTFTWISLIIIFILLIPLIIIMVITSKDNNDINSESEGRNSKEINLIKVFKMPNKVKYKEGEIFDRSGMVIKALYSDNSESFIDGYIIHKISPLSLYNSTIIISYREKTTTFNIHIINEEGKEIHPNPSKEKYTAELIEGITRFEMEDSDISKWRISDDNTQNKIIERENASGGKFLCGIEKIVSSDIKLNLNINLGDNLEIIMRVSYSQNERWKGNNAYISSMYTYILDDNKEIGIENDTFLNSTTKWQIFKYRTFSLPKGLHTISLEVNPNIDTETPNIDYIEFETKLIDNVPIDGDDEMPSYDFHTLLQYQYILDKNPGNIFNYATGVSDLSRPKGNILNFSESIQNSSDSYSIQISSSENFNTSDTKTINNLKEKYYILKNLKLGQKLFYRGAIKEDDLINSKIYKLTVNTLAPRNLDIPGVDNSRDIGGFRTSLVNGGVIKQGLYFRTAKLSAITEEGKRILIEDLGVKIEIDLRTKPRSASVEGIEYAPIPIPSSSSGTTRFENFNEEYTKVFNLIAEADKNPIVLHCSAGADRTGIMTFALLILLGCEYNDVARDYLFTNFGVQGKRYINRDFTNWWNKLDNYEGNSKTEKCKKWLMSKGIEESTLEHIRAIFIDGYKENVFLSKHNAYKYNNHNKEIANKRKFKSNNLLKKR